MKSLFIPVIALFILMTSCSQIEVKDNSAQTEEIQSSEPMFLENQSKYNFDETVEKLTVEVELKTWKVSAVHNLQEALKKSGTDVLPIKVFALCHPMYASKILLQDDGRIMSTLMPCRLSVYEKSNGLTYISRMDMGVFTKSIGGDGEDVMMAASNEIEEIISGLIVTE